MAKKRVKNRPKLRSQGRARVSPGERLVFKNAKGRFTKYSKAKNLIVQVWDKKGFTGRVLNKIKKGKPVPAKWKKTTIRMKERAKAFRMKPKGELVFICHINTSSPLVQAILLEPNFHKCVRKMLKLLDEHEEFGLQVDMQSAEGAYAARAMFIPPMTRKEVIEQILNLLFESYRKAPFRASPKKRAYSPEKPHVRSVKCVLTIQLF